MNMMKDDKHLIRLQLSFNMCSNLFGCIQPKDDKYNDKQCHILYNLLFG